MESEKFKLSRRTIKYKCGCERDIFGFESMAPSSVCEKHGEEIEMEYNTVDEL